jgi:hypothetical protein
MAFPPMEPFAIPATHTSRSSHQSSAAPEKRGVRHAGGLQPRSTSLDQQAPAATRTRRAPPVLHATRPAKKYPGTHTARRAATPGTTPRPACRKEFTSRKRTRRQCDAELAERPSRSADTTHLRRGPLATLPSVPRVSLPPASSDRCDGATGTVSHHPSINIAPRGAQLDAKKPAAALRILLARRSSRFSARSLRTSADS